jgi:hypothetical protein
MTNKNCDEALSQFPGKIIVVHCDTCDVDYDVREVTNEVQHPHALHVMAFTCPKGHHSEGRRLWSRVDLRQILAGRFALPCWPHFDSIKKDKIRCEIGAMPCRINR